jgi:type I restriction enzyme S subunit
MIAPSEKVTFADFLKVLTTPHVGYKQKEYKEKGRVPIVDQGSSIIGGYTDELDRLLSFKHPVIVFGDHTRRVKFVDFDFAIGADGVKVLGSVEGVEPRFAYLQLMSVELRDRGYARHMGELRKTSFWKPCLETQIEIVKVLEERLSRLDKALADLEMAAQLSKHMFLAALEEAIAECDESSYQSLEECLKVIDQKKKVQRGWSPQCLSHSQSDPSVWAVLKTTAVQKMRYEPQHNKELPKSLQPKSHLEVQNGDFLMTTTGPRNRCGIVCLVTNTPEKLIFSGKILRFQPDSKRLLPAWLELVLASHQYQKRLDELKVGSSDSSVSIGNAQVLAIEVPVPSLTEQKILVDKVDKIQALAGHFESEIEQYSQSFVQLKRAILHEAFSGNLGSK